jgi:trans-aconitate methyltransferase
MAAEFDETFWQQHYSERATAQHSRPNPQLLAEAGELPPGTALDAGCGEGADAVWLAARGWRVTAVDISATAVNRARDHAAAHGPDIAERISWSAADLTAWTPPESAFDLVSSHYVHPAAPGHELFARLATWVAPGGTLLVVGHAPAAAHDADQYDAGRHAPGSHITAEEVTAALDPARWEIVVAQTRTRPAAGHGDHGHGGHQHGGHGHGGHGHVLRDTVLRARRLA